MREHRIQSHAPSVSRGNPGVARRCDDRGKALSDTPDPHPGVATGARDRVGVHSPPPWPQPTVSVPTPPFSRRKPPRPPPTPLRPPLGPCDARPCAKIWRAVETRCSRSTSPDRLERPWDLQCTTKPRMPTPCTPSPVWTTVPYERYICLKMFKGGGSTATCGHRGVQHLAVLPPATIRAQGASQRSVYHA